MCNTIPAFEGLKWKWEELKHTQPSTLHVVDKGLKKLAEYREHIGRTPAYILAIHVYNSFELTGISRLIIYITNSTQPPDEN